MSEVLSCSHLAKSYTDANSTLHVLRDIDLTIRQGEQVAIMGASGSGKSTLLHLLGGLDTPTGGLIRIDGTPIERLNAVTLGRLRNRALGFIYQFHHLLPEFTALENVAMPLLVRGLSSAKAADEAGRMLERVGLSSRSAHPPEHRRVASPAHGQRPRAAAPRRTIHPACESTGRTGPRGPECERLHRRLAPRKRRAPAGAWPHFPGQ